MAKHIALQLDEFFDAVWPFELRSRDSEAMRSVSGNDYDRDDNECRDQRKSAIKCFRSRLCGRVQGRHGLRRRLQFANEPANISRLHWI
jgi:hypothetical protein